MESYLGVRHPGLNVVTGAKWILSELSQEDVSVEQRLQSLPSHLHRLYATREREPQ